MALSAEELPSQIDAGNADTAMTGEGITFTDMLMVLVHPEALAPVTV